MARGRSKSPHYGYRYNTLSRHGPDQRKRRVKAALLRLSRFAKKKPGLVQYGRRRYLTWENAQRAGYAAAALIASPQAGRAYRLAKTMYKDYVGTKEVEKKFVTRRKRIYYQEPSYPSKKKYKKYKHKSKAF